ncbi:MAG: peptidase S9 [Caulobacterales bacterium 68-7]|nr:MAG: peptidase S9 [Caulobacterales bacterium 68-7]
MKLISVLAPLAVVAASPVVAHAEKLTPERVFASPDLAGPRARGVKLSPDGKTVTFLRAKTDDARMTDLWAADVAGGEPKLLVDGRALIPQGRELSEAEKSRRERMGVQSRGVVDYAWDQQGRFILAPVEGDVWLFERASGQTRRLTNTEADEIDSKVSPKGTWVSFVRDNNLYVMPSAGGPERALSTGGTETKPWATADYIAQEELDRDTGYWWSPDDRHVALTYVDQSGVDIVPRPDINANGGVVVEQRYPRPGRPNSVTALYVASVDGGEKVKVDLGADNDVYLTSVDWSADGKTLYAQRLTRDQKRLDILAIDPATGASKVILSETSPHWVEITHDFEPLADGGFLWSSERSGNRHIYLHDAAGKLVRQVTTGDWPVSSILGVDEAKKTVIFSAGKDTPIERRIYSVSWAAPKEPVALTPAGGWWTADVAKVGGAFVGGYSDPKTPPHTGLYRADGKLVRWIEENPLGEKHPFWPYRDRLPTPTYGTIKASDGEDMWWSLRTPPGFDPARKYPVIITTYGGPTGAAAYGQVTRAWPAASDLLYLEAGYVLFTLDNRGTAGRSAAFKTVIDRHLGQTETEDQLAGVAYLKTLPYVDGARIGFTGWSYGGYMTLNMLTAPNSPIAAGAAGAPPTDWALYDTAYTERYMGTPQTNAAGYAASDIVSRIGNLGDGKLLLLHGMADDNVVFENSTRLMAALQAKGVGFEMQLYPGLRHRAGWTAANQLHRMRAMLEFFGRKLKPEAAK